MDRHHGDRNAMGSTGQRDPDRPQSRPSGLRATQRFMDAYVEWHLAILDHQPVDILANVSWLPACFAGQYDALWTDGRIEAVLGAFLRNGVALEISSGFRLPGMHFLRLAKAAGLRFCFGSNGRYPAMGKLDYSLQMARDLQLTSADFWQPGPDGPRAARTRARP